jgi:DNA sulfur modification protein DndD
MVQDLATIQSQLEQSEYLHKRIVERLESEGGDLFSQKSLLELNRARLEADVGAIDLALRDDASGTGPLLLVTDLLKAVHEQVRQERSAINAGLLGGVLEERDALTLKSLREAGTKTNVLRTISELLEQDRDKRTVAAKAPRYLNLSEEAQPRRHLFLRLVQNLGVLLLSRRNHGRAHVMPITGESR